MIVLLTISFALALVTLSTARDVEGDLKEYLNTAGITAVFMDNELYGNATQPYNLRFEYEPIAVAYPTNISQVSASVLAGATQNLSVVARSGGHSYIANGLGGKNGALVIDLSSFKEVTVHEDGTAVLGVGNKLGDIALALNEHGRAIPHGRCSYVGLGGHAAFGGYGFTSRMWGLTLDTILSATVVLADGTITTASKTENSDLFWALRGSASSFGIITSLTVSTHIAPSSAAFGTYTWEMDIASATLALSNFQNFADSGIPPELGTELYFFKGPSNGTVTAQYLAGYFGDFGTYNDTVAPFLGTLPEPAASTFASGNWIEGFGALSYPSLNTSAPNTQDTFYAKSVMTPEAEPITQEAIEAFVTYLATEGFAADIQWFVEIELYGGSNSALNSIPVDETAFAHRDSRFNMQIYGSSGAALFPDDGYTLINGIASSVIENMPEHWDWRAYVNYVEDRLEDWQNAYYGDHYPALKALKAVYDPGNVFNFPTSIEL